MPDKPIMYIGYIFGLFDYLYASKVLSTSPLDALYIELGFFYSQLLTPIEKRHLSLISRLRF